MKVERLTREEAARQAAGAFRVAPGIWIDRAGGLHWSVPELLAFVDLPDTPEHRAAIVATLQEVAAEYGCEEIIQQELSEH